MSDTPHTNFNEFEVTTDQGVKVKVVLAKVAREWERGDELVAARERIGEQSLELDELSRVIIRHKERIAALEAERDALRASLDFLIDRIRTGKPIPAGIELNPRWEAKPQ